MSQTTLPAQQATPQSSPEAAFLAIDRLRLGYDTPQGLREIVRDFSLQLPRGQIACLIGASGCGKSTILRAIAGFEPLRDGSIHLNGRPLSSPSLSVPPEQRQVGMMFQDYALFPHLNVFHNIAFGLRALGRAQRQARVAEMLELVGLRQAAKAWPHELSGGQQQRVALARALAPSPALLLLDEPFSNLDTELREHLAHEVRDILRQGQHTAILVTHNKQEARIMANRVGLLTSGQAVQWRSPDSLG
ncbi:ABC transporter [Vandammella animalimorsus]|uniref:ABC transporter n=1 Tax=Vandammella animalimorsus TaxID=2029117 RepID=A0A2A2AMJ9_9BURK|nr:ABC transporter ATP-binding protein [Vandammella animalimorsus]PAT38126.1 ABC transporter [Vandammella animalimorsus]PAT39815.1 ABC transporter [Vandammella animalimorsus]